VKTLTTVNKGQSTEKAEEEPPGSISTTNETEEEPPSSSISIKSRFFGHVPDEVWNDWTWHFRNRITTVEELAQYIPLSTKEQTQLKLVTTKYPLSVTPYYLSLLNKI
jgi:lysine 2,3-aminomutase